MSTILIADDDAALRDVVRVALQVAGFTVVEASDGQEALTLAAQVRPELVVLDVGMPHLDGLSTCRALRAWPDGGPPILFLTARDEEIDRVLGLELGGDDYVTKPFSPRELASRVKAILRRARPAPAPAPATAAPPPPSEERRAGPVRVDLDQRRVFVHAVEIELTATELDLLATLLDRPGRVYTRDELVERVYGLGYHLSDRTIDSHVRRIRHKLQEAGCERLETVHGVGFRFLP